MALKKNHKKHIRIWVVALFFGLLISIVWFAFIDKPTITGMVFTPVYTGGGMMYGQCIAVDYSGTGYCVINNGEPVNWNSNSIFLTAKVFWNYQSSKQFCNDRYKEGFVNSRVFDFEFCSTSDPSWMCNSPRYVCVYGKTNSGSSPMNMDAVNSITGNAVFNSAYLGGKNLTLQDYYLAKNLKGRCDESFLISNNFDYWQEYSDKSPIDSNFTFYCDGYKLYDKSKAVLNLKPKSITPVEKSTPLVEVKQDKKVVAETYKAVEKDMESQGVKESKFIYKDILLRAFLVTLVSMSMIIIGYYGFKKLNGD